VLKKIVELLLCILHPVAVVLIWFNLAFRRDDWAFTRMAWAIAVIVLRVGAQTVRALEAGAALELVAVNTGSASPSGAGSSPINPAAPGR